MSGSAGGNRISRAAVEKTVQDYIDNVLSKFPGFKDAKATGSYNTGTKQDFGDIDLIVHLDSKDKKLVKQDLAKYFASLPDSVIVPFKSDKYKGKKSLSSGELVTVLYPISGVPDEFVQIDNIVSISEEESTFKNTFLDYPAEVQGLLLGLAKVICLEEDPKKIFARLGITNVPELEANQEYEFNLSSAGLTLRIVTLDNFKELDRTEVWKSSNWSVVKKLFDNYNIDGDFKTLLQDLKSKLKNERSKNRIKGIFKSMVSIKSGEVDTPKGDNKQAALDAVSSLLENKLFKGLVRELILPLIEADSKKTVAIYPGGFKPPHKGHFKAVKIVLEKFPQINKFIIYVGSGTRNGITSLESKDIWEIYEKYLPSNIEIQLTSSPVKATYKYAETHPDEHIIWVEGVRPNNSKDLADIASKTGAISDYKNIELAIIDTQLDESGTDARQALKKGQEAFLPFIPEEVKEKTKIFNTLSKVVTELVTNTKVICDKCGWTWKIADGGKDLYICHNKLPDGSICEHDNNPNLNEGTCDYDTDVKTGKKLDTPGGLEEGKQVGPLYHYTSADGLKGILQSNKINTSEENYLGNELYYISFTRNKNFYKKGSNFGVKTDYRITLDGDKLSDKYKITPFAYRPGWNYEDNWEYDWLEDEPESVVRDFFNNTGDYDEQEERISFKDPEDGIDNIKNYILAVNKVEDLKEGKENNDYKKYIPGLTKYMIDQGMNIKPLPVVKFINNDKANAENVFGKTAFYNPEEKSITLFTMNRHPKDVLRSFSHEMVHHMQNLENRLNNINTTNTNEDGDLPEIEEEAYKLGNMMLRTYEDSKKNK
jgi:hypothetical protein